MTMPRTIGRFELRRELGQGAQATVWLGWDAQLEREVAVKLLSPPEPGAAAGHDWLNEARALSRLTHPNVVPVFEAGEEGGRRFMVFEFVSGGTLGDLLRSEGPMPARESAELMLGVLDALAAAHAEGIVHRDLKPTNVLIGADGRPRVMDFGIAARVSATPDGLIVGTPGFMSPEAARGAAPSPAMDVFSCGLMMARMLCGVPLLRERDPHRAIARVQHEDLVLPVDPAVPVDDALRTIVQRAIARDPGQRWPSAAAMRDALARWLAPEEAALDAAGSGGSATLEFLLRRMRHKSDFPALSDAVARIQRLSDSEAASLGSLSDEILKDVALTNKLLRLANTAHFGRGGAGSVSTVSRAVALVGFTGIRNLALSALLLEHMRDKAHAERLRDEFIRALMAAMLAGELCPAARISEEAFLVGLLQALGRLLAAYYFPEEADRIRDDLQRRAGGATAAPKPADEDRAAQAVLGIGYTELGAGIARAWGLPDAMQQAMRRAHAPVSRAASKGVDYLRALGAAGTDLTAAMMFATDAAREATLDELVNTHARALDLAPAAVRAAAETARERLNEVVSALGIRLPAASAARRLMSASLAPPHAGATAAAVAGAAAGKGAQGAGESKAGAVPPSRPAHDSPSTMTVPGAPVARISDAAAEQLAVAVQQVTQTLVAEPFQLDRVLREILQSLLDALSLRRIVLCLRDPRGENLAGRIGLGDAAEGACRAMQVPLKAGTHADLFTAVCLKGADLLIEDARAANVFDRLPPWYRKGLDAPAFLLLPLTIRNAPFGLIYGDRSEAGGIRIGERELSLVKTLRNQAVMAFKTAGAG
jgi:eukaryotic-like serine/threonine-protein kinase